MFDLELAGKTPALEVDSDLPDLGPAAIGALVEGLDKLAPDALLPTGFDPGVLKALASLTPVGHGVPLVSFNRRHFEGCPGLSLLP